ncbi:MAG: class I SAM-dependent methyltransferase [Solirubrobacterales bacterium]
MPTDEMLERAYADWYRPTDGRFSGAGDLVLRYLRGRLASRLDRIAPAGPILDVGAGDGTLIDELMARGRVAFGIDRQSSHRSVHEMNLAEVGGDWAAIVFWHSLEHLPQAGVALEQAASMLMPGGVLIVALPNPDSVQAAVFGDRWFGIDFPRHLVHVPARALTARLTSLGMAIERVSYVRGGQIVFGWLHGWVGRLPGNPNLYDAIRRRQARQKSISRAMRMAALVTAAVLLPFAAICAALESTFRRGGTTYVEARRV